MGSAAMKKVWEGPMEERLARVEAHVEHIQSDVTEIKGDIRRLDAKIDRLDDKVDSLKDEFAGFKGSVAESMASAKLWAVMLYVALAGGLLAVLARGFGWM